ncbi:hypothetical protein [Streptomyces sp. NPDC088910]|uniref:hypothetical protein n=3 Tax=unclassified Streptomyces TaxID=2593676 RepID=UPI00381B18F1
MRRAAGPLACLASAAALAACGVPPTSVIQAGEPAVGMTPGVSVYFLSGDTLRAVPRRAPDAAGPVVALRLLFAGPGDADPTTLTTRLPSLPRPPVIAFDGVTTVVRLPAGVDRLSPLAMDQVVCTVAANPGGPQRTAPPGGASAVPTAVPDVPTAGTPRSASPSPDVRVIGAGWALSRLVESCPS